MKAAFFAATIVAGATFATTAWTQDKYPSRPVRVIVSSSAGTATDIAARAIAARLSIQFGQPFVIENVAGAAGTLGAQSVAHAKPDGYTLLVTFSGVITVNPYVDASGGFNTMTDLAPLAPIANTQLMLLVNPSVKANTLAELVELAKVSNPPLTYSYGGVANASYWGIEKLKKAAGIDLEPISYAGATPATVAAVSGEVSITMSGSSAAQYFRSGELRPLAVTGEKRMEEYPEIPALAETYPGLTQLSWQALYGPPGMPDEIVTALSDAVIAHRNDPEVLQAFAAGAQYPATLNREEFIKSVNEEYEAMGKLAAELGVLNK